jgi:manganese/iron transport system ATP-binding protein
MTDRLPRLHIVSISVRMGEHQALEDVSLDVCAGELVGLIGPNGAGKTTLLRAILGLTAMQSGRVLVDGEPPARTRWKIGYVPQRHEFAWDFPVSVWEAVMSARTRMIGWFRGPRKADREAVDEALERAGIPSLRDRPIGELSGGQRQRVLVARALALRPSVLLLDEPFTGVDVPTQELLGELLARLRSDGHAILMTTHDVAAATRSCSRVSLLNRRIIADGPPSELRDPELWLRTFGVSSSGDLLTSVGATVAS